MTDAAPSLQGRIRNSLRLPMDAADDAILTQIAAVVLDTQIVWPERFGRPSPNCTRRARRSEEKRTAPRAEIARLGDQ